MDDCAATETQETIDRDQTLKLIGDALHRTMVHYGFWWREVEKQHGLCECLAIEQEVWETWFPLQLKRLAKVLGFELKDGLPAALAEKTDEELRDCLEALSVNWLAQDGIWFQAVERRHGLKAAQRANDTAWSRFSPLEAHATQALADIPPNGGLDALETALRLRLYAQINRWTIERPDDHTLRLYMNDCRVQAARKRKGLADYPCISGGTIEYTSFAQTIDSRISTRCLGCPPGEHPEDWYCGWEFTITAK